VSRKVIMEMYVNLVLVKFVGATNICT